MSWHVPVNWSWARKAWRGLVGDSVGQKMAVGQNLRYLLGNDYHPKLVYFEGLNGMFTRVPGF